MTPPIVGVPILDMMAVRPINANLLADLESASAVAITGLPQQHRHHKRHTAHQQAHTHRGSKWLVHDLVVVCQAPQTRNDLFHLHAT